MSINLSSSNTDHQMFKIFQLNYSSISGEKEKFISPVIIIDYDCILISESWLSSNENFALIIIELLDTNIR